VTFESSSDHSRRAFDSTINLSQSSLGRGSDDFTIRGVVQEREANCNVGKSDTPCPAQWRNNAAGRVLSNEQEPIRGATVSLDGRTAMTMGQAVSALRCHCRHEPAIDVDGQNGHAPIVHYPVIVEPATDHRGRANVVP